MILGLYVDSITFENIMLTEALLKQVVETCQWLIFFSFMTLCECGYYFTEGDNLIANL